MHLFLCMTNPAGHWQPATQGCLHVDDSSLFAHVRGQGGPHSSKTAPSGQVWPTGDENNKRLNLLVQNKREKSSESLPLFQL